jgi:hypothetical protein
MNHLSIFESEEIFWNQKSREESKVTYIWKEKTSTMEKLDTFKIKQKGIS